MDNALQCCADRRENGLAGTILYSGLFSGIRNYCVAVGSGSLVGFNSSFCTIGGFDIISIILLDSLHVESWKVSAGSVFWEKRVKVDVK